MSSTPSSPIPTVHDKNWENKMTMAPVKKTNHPSSPTPTRRNPQDDNDEWTKQMLKAPLRPNNYTFR